MDKKATKLDPKSSVNACPNYTLILIFMVLLGLGLGLQANQGFSDCPEEKTADAEVEMWMPHTYSRSSVELRPRHGWGDGPRLRSAISHPDVRSSGDLEEIYMDQCNNRVYNYGEEAYHAWILESLREKFKRKDSDTSKKNKNKSRKQQFLDYLRREWPKVLLNIVKFVVTVLTLILWMYAMLEFMQIVSGADSTYNKYHAVFPGKQTTMYFKIPENLTDSLDVAVIGPFITRDQQVNEIQDSALKSSPRMFGLRLMVWKTPKSEVASRVALTPPQSVQASKSTVMFALFAPSAAVNKIDPMDYNNVKRMAQLYVTKSTKDGEKKENEEDMETEYILEFTKSGSQKSHIPFAFSYNIDKLTMFQRVLTGILPLFVFAGLLVLQWSVPISCFLAVSIAGAGYWRSGKPLKVVDMIRWVGPDELFYYIAIMLYTNILSDTNLHSFIAFHFLRATRFRLIPSIIFIVVLCGLGSFFFQSQFIAVMMTPFAIRLMELSSMSVRPMLIVLMTTCNVMGRASYGTFGFKTIMEHRITRSRITGMSESKEDVIADIKRCLSHPSFLVFFGCLVYIFIIQTAISRPFYLSRRREIVDAENTRDLWKHTLYTSSSVSRRWTTIHQKVEAKRKELLAEKKWMAAQPDVPYKYYPYIMDLHDECRITNKFLLVKLVILVVVLVLMVYPYITDKRSSYFDFFRNKHPEQLIEDGYLEMTLGFIAIYLILLVLLLLHAQELELILKRLDFDFIMMYMAFRFIASVFIMLTKPKQHSDPMSRIAQYMWTNHGLPLGGTRHHRIHYVMLCILLFTSVTGLFSEITVYNTMLDTAISFSAKSQLGSYDIILTSFVLSTYYWGMATKIGTPTNMLVTGKAWSQGYNFKFFRFFFYGFPLAVLSIAFLYIYLLTYRLPEVTD